MPYLFFYAVAIVAVIFAAYWSQRAWGLWAALVVLFIGGVFIRFVPFPFGTLLAASGAVPVIYAAKTRLFRLQAPATKRVVEGRSSTESRPPAE